MLLVREQFQAKQDTVSIFLNVSLDEVPVDDEQFILAQPEQPNHSVPVRTLLELGSAEEWSEQAVAVARQRGIYRAESALVVFDHKFIGSVAPDSYLGEFRTDIDRDEDRWNLFWEAGDEKGIVALYCDTHFEDLPTLDSDFVETASSEFPVPIAELVRELRGGASLEAEVQAAANALGIKDVMYLFAAYEYGSMDRDRSEVEGRPGAYFLGNFKYVED